MYVQAGGGVVADSDPEAEYQESCNKARALIRAAEEAVRFAAVGSSIARSIVQDRRRSASGRVVAAMSLIGTRQSAPVCQGRQPRLQGRDRARMGMADGDGIAVLPRLALQYLSAGLPRPRRRIHCRGRHPARRTAGRNARPAWAPPFPAWCGSRRTSGPVAPAPRTASSCVRWSGDPAAHVIVDADVTLETIQRPGKLLLERLPGLFRGQGWGPGFSIALRLHRHMHQDLVTGLACG